MLEQESAEAALELLGNVLAGRGLAYEVVVVGGSALLLRGLIRRPTNDIDVIAFVVNDEYVSANPMPDDILQAVADVADAMGLAPNWLNSGPTSQIQSGLPEGFRDRVETRTYGSLVVHIAGRLDQIHLKLFAIVDQDTADGKHGDDLRQLNPSRSELITAARWVITQDAGEVRRVVIDALRAFGVEDAERDL